MKVVITVLLLVCPVAGVSAETVATHSAGAIYDHEVQAWLDAYLGRYQNCRIAVEELAVIKLLVREAEQTGLDQDPVVARKLRLVDAMAWRDAARQAVETAAPSPTETEITEMVAAKGQGFERPPQIRFRWIIRRTEAGDTEEEQQARVFLADLRKQIVDGSLSFEEAARQHSEAEDQSRAGAAVTVPAAGVSSDLAKIVFDLDEGEISPVIQGDAGLFLFQVEKHFPATFTTDAEKRDKAQRLLIRDSKRESWARFKEDVLRAADPVIRLDRIGTSDPDAVVLRLATGEKLTAAETIDMKSLAPEEAEERLTDIAIMLAMPRAAAKRGFTMSDELQMESDLRRIRKLATEVMNRILDREVGVPTAENAAARTEAFQRVCDERLAAGDFTMVKVPDCTVRPRRLLSKAW